MDTIMDTKQFEELQKKLQDISHLRNEISEYKSRIDAIRDQDGEIVAISILVHHNQKQISLNREEAERIGAILFKMWDGHLSNNLQELSMKLR